MTDEERRDKRIHNYFDELVPLALQFMRLVRVSGMTDMADILVDPTSGYVRCSIHEATIDMTRLYEDSEFEIRNFGVD